VAQAPTGRVTFFFTDIQGSTAMWERDARRMQAALARHDEILRSVITEHGGLVFKMVGDACCAAFSSASDALEAALAAQRAIFAEPWDDRVRVRVRMALHTGEAEERGGDYFGPPLNRVARLLSAGHGGQTLLSRSTRELLGDGDLPEGVELRDMGEHRLRDLKEPERIFQVVPPDLPSEFPLLKTLEAPSEDDRYRLIKRIGSGGMAEVYLAYDEVLEREVAFKVLDRKHAESKEAVERFRREARSAASLSHDPNIVAIHDRGETQDGTYYIVMEYMEGGTLEDLIEREGPLPPGRATEITIQVAKALSVAHEKGVVHRDIKPQNILLSRTGEAKVADFGIARAATATTMTQAGSVMGTVHYISPEQALGEAATPRSDLYSLGVVLYEMLTGKLPYDAETTAGIIMQHVGGLSRSPRETNREVPEELDAVTARLLAREPEDRYPDAHALVEDLDRAREGLPLDAATMERRAARKSGGGLKSRGVLAALGLVLASVGVIAAVAIAQGLGPFAEPSTLSGVGPLEPGTYRTDEFEPALTFSVGEGWVSGRPELPDALEIYLDKPDPLPVLGFYTPQAVVDQSDPRGETLEPAPVSVDGWVEWLQSHPNLKTEEPVSVEVGGASGVRIDTVVSSKPEGRPAMFWQLSDGTTITDTKGSRSRTIVVDVGGEPVLIAASASSDRFEKFLPRAQSVLDTVEWGGT
jgi:class 3 adenylate cyclase/tRNA A-37 threonylcarbamoyl transferase component Bud32